MKQWALAFCLISAVGLGADVPGGSMRTATHLPSQTYEMLISPTYVFTGDGGAYLSAELRYQPYDTFGAGFGFGAGELGFNFGASGVWHVAPHLQLIPRVALVGGLFVNRVAGANYFVVKVAPTLSHTFEADWGQITPYAALNFAPSFRLSEAQNLFSIKGSLGSQLTLKGADGLRVMAELSLGVLNSTYEMSLGVSYPFAAL